MKIVDVVKINELKEIFKNGEKANSIQVAKIISSDGNVCEFNIIVGIGLYKVGDEAVYIQPDYCIPKTPIFSEYHYPNGDESKSKLGKNGRIKAVKFNFNFADSFDPIYSNGILIPLSEFKEDLKCIDDLVEYFGITKYVAEDSFESSMYKGKNLSFPSFLYHTDEDRIENSKNRVEKCFEENETLSFTIKRDGSSSTIYCKKIEDDFKTGICSRNNEKDTDLNEIESYIDVDGNELKRFFNKELNTLGWRNDVNNNFYSNDEIKNMNLQTITKKVSCAWVDTANKHNYLNLFEEYNKKYNVELALRGELIGEGNKGSGNKLNSDSKLEKKIVFFGIDDLSEGFSKRLNYSNEHNLIKVCEELGFEYTKEIFNGVFNYEQIIKKCNEYFEHIKKTENRIIEGIVIRSKYSNKLSVKYINPEYDSKS